MIPTVQEYGGILNNVDSMLNLVGNDKSIYLYMDNSTQIFSLVLGLESLWDIEKTIFNFAGFSCRHYIIIDNKVIFAKKYKNETFSF